MMNRTGFTLIELLVVIAIIGILIGIVQPILTVSASRTYEYQCESHLRQIGLAMNAYAQDNGAFPGRLVGVDTMLQDRSLLGCPKTSREYYLRPAPERSGAGYGHRRLREPTQSVRQTAPSIRLGLPHADGGGQREAR